jgi:hypothetical protein
MKNFLLAFKYFLLAYLIGTIVGFGTFYIHVVVMWIALFTIMPVVFGYFFYLYLKNTGCTLKESFRESNLLIVFWIVASFLLDGLVYIVIIPVFFGYTANWTFFIDQSPWIWMNYGTVILLGHISRFIYLQRLKKSASY